MDPPVVTFAHAWVSGSPITQWDDGTQYILKTQLQIQVVQLSIYLGMGRRSQDDVISR